MPWADLSGPFGAANTCQVRCQVFLLPHVSVPLQVGFHDFPGDRLGAPFVAVLDGLRSSTSRAGRLSSSNSASSSRSLSGSCKAASRSCLVFVVMLTSVGLFTT